MERAISRKPRWFSINRRDLGQIKQEELQSTTQHPPPTIHRPLPRRWQRPAPAGASARTRASNSVPGRRRLPLPLPIPAAPSSAEQIFF